MGKSYSPLVKEEEWIGQRKKTSESFMCVCKRVYHTAEASQLATNMQHAAAAGLPEGARSLSIGTALDATTTHIELGLDHLLSCDNNDDPQEARGGGGGEGPGFTYQKYLATTKLVCFSWACSYSYSRINIFLDC